MPFQGLLDAVQQSIEEVTEGVKAVLCHPPHNTCRIAESANSENGQLSLKDMSVLFYVLSLVMDLGVDRHKFCSP